METNLIITDDFYQNPDEVREYALSQEFSVRGNYPGQRTSPVFYDGLKNSIQYIIQQAGGKITQFEEFDYNTAFQYTTIEDKSWIHADQTTKWAGVCYLTPTAPITAGTALYKHKETGLYKAATNPDGSYNKELMDKIYEEDCNDVSKWEMVDIVGNKYNRLVLYRGDLFHSSLDYFGTSKYDGRLFQTFFFNTEF
jgi:hypothetical protein